MRKFFSVFKKTKQGHTEATKQSLKEKISKHAGQPTDLEKCERGFFIWLLFISCASRLSSLVIPLFSKLLLFSSIQKPLPDVPRISLTFCIFPHPSHISLSLFRFSSRISLFPRRQCFSTFLQFSSTLLQNLSYQVPFEPPRGQPQMKPTNENTTEKYYVGEKHVRRHCTLRLVLVFWAFAQFFRFLHFLEVSIFLNKF